MKSVPEFILEGLRNNKAFLQFYLAGMSNLYQSKIFDFLRELGRARLLGIGENETAMASQASYSIGYNQCLEDLFYFKEKFLDTAVPESASTMPDYGGLDVALKNGDITQHEYDAIKRGGK